jgi:hypothetical protein
VRPQGLSLRGDIDGDGRLDRVTIRYSPHTSPECGFVVAVHSRTGVFGARVGVDNAGPEPFLLALVRVGPRGLGILVQTWHGAATVGAALYGFDGARLLRYRIQGRHDLSFFGSLASERMVDCYGATASGAIVETTQSESAAPRRFKRVFYRLTGTTFRRLSSRTIRVAARAVESYRAMWIGRQPFQRCTVARRRKRF